MPNLAARTEPRVAHIKGEGIRQFINWYLAKWGEPRLFQFVADLPPEAREVYDITQPSLGIIASGWYPAPAFHALIDAMLSVYPPDQRRAFAREAAKATIDSTLKGVYRFLFEAMMTPDRYLGRAQKLFSRFYDCGTIEKIKVAPNIHRSVIRDWHSHHPVLCDVMLHMGEYVYPALGCRNVIVRRISCVSAGDPYCSYDASWDLVSR
jgi:hypothetical protein